LIPEVTFVNQVHQVELTQNRLFTGREDELTYLHNTMMVARRKKTRGCCTIHSMGGVGKTQLALEYTYRYRRHFKFIFWLSAERGMGLAQCFGEIAKVAHPEYQSSPTGLLDAVQKAKSWLSNSGKSPGMFYLSHAIIVSR
jgi:hypothetical protein